MIDRVLSAFKLDKQGYASYPFGSGLINNTWKVVIGKHSYILQRINDKIFKNPYYIAENIRLIADYFHTNYPGYLFPAPVKTRFEEDVVLIEGEGYFRLFPFIENSHTVDTVQTPDEAYEAAKQFGRFTKLLSGFDAKRLKITLPDFHNLSLRFTQFQTSLQHGNSERINKSKESISTLQKMVGIVQKFESIKRNGNFKTRVTHHDTKISNILFDENNKGLCVIDLDTVMPGYFISDIGDMMRTYLSPVSEEEKDFSKIEVRTEYFKAIVDGYMHEMSDELTSTEKKHFVYAAKFLIYMQALRFLTDYFNNDVYYGARYPDQNFVRANNQIALLLKLLEKEEELNLYC